MECFGSFRSSRTAGASRSGRASHRAGCTQQHQSSCWLRHSPTGVVHVDRCRAPVRMVPRWRRIAIATSCWCSCVCACVCVEGREMAAAAATAMDTGVGKACWCRPGGVTSVRPVGTVSRRLTYLPERQCTGGDHKRHRQLQLMLALHPLSYRQPAAHAGLGRRRVRCPGQTWPYGVARELECVPDHELKILPRSCRKRPN